MLQIDLDTPDALITDPGLSIIDPSGVFAPAVLSAAESSPYFIAPSNNTLLLRPMQLLPSWPLATKFRAGDYGTPDGWEEQQVRGEGDWWMHTTKQVDAPLSLGYTFPPNTGWFIEFRAYAQPKAPDTEILDFAFGQYCRIVLDSAGKLDLFDTRLSASQPAATGNIASGKDFKNQDVTLMVLPYRRSRILVWSPSLGGYLDAPVIVPNDGNITEACAPSVYPDIRPPAALVAVTPLLYPADGVPAIQASKRNLPGPLTQEPQFTGSVLDQSARTQISFTVLTPYESGGPPVKSFQYEVIMTGNLAHQTAEEQGVVGIGPSGPNTSGDGVFAGGAYPYSLYTPFLYLTVYGYPRTLGPKGSATTTLTGILDAKLTLSKDRAAKSFSFVVDNPANITGVGANYRSLKDLQNRRCRAYLTNPTLEAGGSLEAIAADTDPDTPLIVDYGCTRVYLFDGFTDQPDFVDGVNSRVQIRCLGLRKRLRNYLFFDQPHYDGMPVNTVVADVLSRAGFVGPADTEPTGMALEIFTQTNTMNLPAATPGDEPLFTPAIGTTAEDFLTTIMNYTGWMLDDLITVGSANACWYWTSPSYYASTVYAEQGSPAVSLSSTYVSRFADSLPDSTRSNQGLGSLAALGHPAPKQSLEELIANEIFVVGRDDSGNVIVASARDEASVSDRSASNYVGEVRTYILASLSINSQSAANSVCAVLFQNLTQPKTRLTFTLADYYPQLGISAPLTIDGYWSGEIDGIEADLGMLRVRKTAVSVLKSV